MYNCIYIVNFRFINNKEKSRKNIVKYVARFFCVKMG